MGVTAMVAPTVAATALDAPPEVGLPIAALFYVGGPVAGYLYGGMPQAAQPGVAVRSMATAGAYAAIRAMISHSDDTGLEGLVPLIVDVTLGTLLVVTACVAIAMYDLARLERLVRRQSQAAWHLAPVQGPGAGTGLQLTVIL